LEKTLDRPVNFDLWLCMMNEENDPRKKVGAKLREIRLSQGLRQTDLVKMTGIRVETISRVENGRNAPTLNTIMRLDKALGCRSELFRVVIQENQQRVEKNMKVGLARALGCRSELFRVTVEIQENQQRVEKNMKVGLLARALGCRSELFRVTVEIQENQQKVEKNT